MVAGPVLQSVLLPVAVPCVHVVVPAAKMMAGPVLLSVVAKMLLSVTV